MSGRVYWGSTAFGLCLVTIAATLLIKLPSGHAKDLGAPLDLCRLKLAFSEDFNDLSAAAWEMGDARWTAHTPWAGDFGDAAFTDPGKDFPFTVKDGILSITAKKDEEGNWRSGLLASADGNQKGFALQYGYFEARMKMPPGTGTWPAFWLATSAPKDRTEPSFEVDIVEYYGNANDRYEAATHVWHKDGSPNEGELLPIRVPPGSLIDEFHTYGATVDPQYVTYYLDRKPVWRVKTPAAHKLPLLMLVNLALGSGWPITDTPNPSVLQVDYVHAYRFKSADEVSDCPAE